MDLRNLHAEFPREAIHWRAQSVTKDGTKAMALAYLDARAVMNRLDDVCGSCWQDDYTETPSGRVICRIGIDLGDGFIWRSDGAGDTDVEGEKGGISAAFKRAAVKWGIGRYLYDMPAPWVPCESWQGQDGKFRWKKWKEDPWKYVGNRALTFGDVGKSHDAINQIRAVVNLEDLAALWKSLPRDLQEDDDVFAEKENRKAELGAALAHQGAG